MDISFLDPTFFFAALYAETHYRFRFFPFSLYYRRRPEIIFDAPHRLDPGQALPVLLTVKDAHRFPVEVGEVTITATSGKVAASQTFRLHQAVSDPLWHRIFHLDVGKLPPGAATVHARAAIVGGTRRSAVNQDNHPGLSHRPLKVWISADPLPGLPGWFAGELHCHTEFGGDQVEFGAPLEAYQTIAPAMGLQWVALTDHSYNLDDREDDCLHDDPDLAKWRRLQAKVSELNRRGGGAVLVAGEELSCRSAKGRNVHLLVLGESRFLPGSGDSAQRWLRTRSELAVSEALASLSAEACAIAAHPFAPVPLLERLLVGRGPWTPADLRHPRLDGWQIWNGREDAEDDVGLRFWMEALATGQRVRIFAGNDAHGNFNRFRQVRLPMVQLHENQSHLFGEVTTRVQVEGALSAERIVAALKTGKAVISSGPALETALAPGNGRRRAVVRFRSSAEFGAVESLKLFCLEPPEVQEMKVTAPDPRLPDPYAGTLVFELPECRGVTAALECGQGSRVKGTAVANPLWFENPTRPPGLGPD